MQCISKNRRVEKETKVGGKKGGKGKRERSGPGGGYSSDGPGEANLVML